MHRGSEYERRQENIEEGYGRKTSVDFLYDQILHHDHNKGIGGMQRTGLSEK